MVRPARFELPPFWFVASKKTRSLQIYLVCLASLTNQSALLFLLIVVPNVVRKQKGDRPAPSRVRIQAPTSRGSGLVSIEASTYAQRPKRACRTRSGAAAGAFASRQRAVAEETSFRATGSDACGKGEQSRTPIYFSRTKPGIAKPDRS